MDTSRHSEEKVANPPVPADSQKARAAEPESFCLEDEMELKPEQISTRKDYVRYVEQLRHDLEHNPDNWQNRDLKSFLEALSRYAQDVDGYYMNSSISVDADEPSWRVFADLLTGASMYE